MPNPRPPIGVYNSFTGILWQPTASSPASATQPFSPAAADTSHLPVAATKDNGSAPNAAADVAAARTGDSKVSLAAADLVGPPTRERGDNESVAALDLCGKSTREATGCEAKQKTSNVANGAQCLEACLCTDLAFRLGSCLAIHGE